MRGNFAELLVVVRCNGCAIVCVKQCASNMLQQSLGDQAKGGQSQPNTAIVLPT